MDPSYSEIVASAEVPEQDAALAAHKFGEEQNEEDCRFLTRLFFGWMEAAGQKLVFDRKEDEYEVIAVGAKGSKLRRGTPLDEVLEKANYDARAALFCWAADEGASDADVRSLVGLIYGWVHRNEEKLVYIKRTKEYEVAPATTATPPVDADDVLESDEATAALFIWAADYGEEVVNPA